MPAAIYPFPVISAYRNHFSQNRFGNPVQSNHVYFSIAGLVY